MNRSSFFQNGVSYSAYLLHERVMARALKSGSVSSSSCKGVNAHPSLFWKRAEKLFGWVGASFSSVVVSQPLCDQE